MATRGDGKTTRNIETAMRDVLQGIPVVFVVPTRNMIRYSLDIAARVCTPTGKNISQGELQYGDAVFRVRTVSSSAEGCLGFRGKIHFDHAAFRQASLREVRDWRALEHGCNVRHVTKQESN